MIGNHAAARSLLAVLLLTLPLLGAADGAG